MEEIVDTLTTLEAAEIPYCVLRNYEFAAGGTTDGDIDVLVRSEDQERIDDLLTAAEFYPFEGDTSRQTRYRGYIASKQTIVTIDLYWDDPTYNGLPILDGEQTLANRRRHEDIWILSEEDYFVEMVFHPALNKNQYRRKYREELERLRHSVDGDAARSHGKQLFGDRGKQAIDAALQGEYDRIVEDKWRLVGAGLRREPALVLRLLWNLILLREVVRPLRSIGNRLRISGTPVIAFVGPDGVGKSTTVERLAEQLGENGIETKSAVLGVHSGATPLLKTVRRVYNRLSGTPSQSEARKTGSATLGERSTTWRAIVPVADWIIRYVLAQSRDGDALLADRYLHELVVYADPGPLRHLFKFFEPSQGYILEDTQDRLSERSEFDEESVEAFRNRLHEIDWDRITVEATPEETVDELLELIVPKLLKSLSRNE